MAYCNAGVSLREKARRADKWKWKTYSTNDGTNDDNDEDEPVREADANVPVLVGH